MNEVEKFEFNGFELDVIGEDKVNNPLFIAADVCEFLGLKNVSRAIASLDDDEKLTLPMIRSGQSRDMVIVNESGLYSLIFKSRKDEARAFRKWVTGEVLPSIRKTGEYIHAEYVNRLLVQVKNKERRLEIEREKVRFTRQELLKSEDLIKDYDENKWLVLGALAFFTEGLTQKQIENFCERFKKLRKVQRLIAINTLVESMWIESHVVDDIETFRITTYEPMLKQINKRKNIDW